MYNDIIIESIHHVILNNHIVSTIFIVLYFVLGWSICFIETFVLVLKSFSSA